MENMKITCNDQSKSECSKWWENREALIYLTALKTSTINSKIPQEETDFCSLGTSFVDIKTLPACFSDGRWVLGENFFFQNVASFNSILLTCSHSTHLWHRFLVTKTRRIYGLSLSWIRVGYRPDTSVQPAAVPYYCTITMTRVPLHSRLFEAAL